MEGVGQLGVDRVAQRLGLALEGGDPLGVAGQLVARAVERLRGALEAALRRRDLERPGGDRVAQVGHGGVQVGALRAGLGGLGAGVLDQRLALVELRAQRLHGGLRLGELLLGRGAALLGLVALGAGGAQLERVRVVQRVEVRVRGVELAPRRVELVAQPLVAVDPLDQLLGLPDGVAQLVAQQRLGPLGARPLLGRESLGRVARLALDGQRVELREPRLGLGLRRASAGEESRLGRFRLGLFLRLEQPRRARPAPPRARPAAAA